MRGLLAVALTAILATPCVAQVPNVDLNKIDMFSPLVTGNALHDVCGRSETDVACVYYVIGVADTVMAYRTMFQLMGRPKAAPCLAEGVTARQLVDIAKNYLRDHPEKRQNAADGLVFSSMAEAFPCPKP